MPNEGQINFLHAAGVEFRSAESPLLWSHLESRFTESTGIGSKFTALPAASVAALIAEGEAALLDDMAGMLRDTGKVGHVTHVLNLPYPVGTEAVRDAREVDAEKVITLIQAPGLPTEHRIRVMLAHADEIPCTNTLTIEGGVYPDGHTAGFLSLCPGDLPAHGRGDDAGHVFLATDAEIRSLAAEMLEKAEEITTATQEECAAMVERAMKILG